MKILRQGVDCVLMNEADREPMDPLDTRMDRVVVEDSFRTNLHRRAEDDSVVVVVVDRKEEKDRERIAFRSSLFVI